MKNKALFLNSPYELGRLPDVPCCLAHPRIYVHCLSLFKCAFAQTRIGSKMASPKRSISSDSEDERHSKRARVTESQESSSSSELSDILDQAQGLEINIDPPSVVSTPSLHNQSRSALQRSLAIVLQHDGFRSATPEALESFTQLVETCTDSNS